MEYRKVNFFLGSGTLGRYVDAGVVLGGRYDCGAEMWLEEMELLL
jgi:ABC-type antimicrobial peptide transport system permease subunit